MRMFGDDDKIADPGIAADPAQNLRLPFDWRIAPEPTLRLHVPKPIRFQRIPRDRRA
jgi:hypothetical protein